GQGQYFMATQWRPSVDRFYMVMHVRKMFWADNGWPMVSPQRYANVEQTPITKEEIIGEYEQVIHGYVRVPGYAEEQTDPHINKAVDANPRSEEHTSELQSRENLVCRLLLEKKKN